MNSQQELERLRKENKILREFVTKQANRDNELKYTDTYYIAKHDVIFHVKNEARRVLDAIDTPAAPLPASENAEGTRLQNRNTEQFEIVDEYHNGDFYAYPVTYHGKEILNWHIYNKTADKNNYCVERNIRTRAHAVAQVDMLAEMVANAASSAAADTVAGSGNSGNGGEG